MVTFTVRDLDSDTATRLRQEASRRGQSINALLRVLIRTGLGLERQRRHDDLQHLAGTWSEEEHIEFIAAVEPFERVDEELWT